MKFFPKSSRGLSFSKFLEGIRKGLYLDEAEALLRQFDQFIINKNAQHVATALDLHAPFITKFDCGCPAASEVTDVPDDDCVTRIGEVQRVGIQRTLTATAINWITIASTNPNLKLTWTDLQSASDSTKVQFTPIVHAPNHDTSGRREAGGAGARAGGITTILGNSPSPFNAELHDIKVEIEDALKDYRCEKAVSVFLINEVKKIWGLVDDLGTPLTFRGIPAKAFWLSDRQFGQHAQHDKHMLSWMFEPEFSKLLYAVTPLFDPLIEL